MSRWLAVLVWLLAAPAAAAPLYGTSGTLGPAGAPSLDCDDFPAGNCYECTTSACTPSGTWESAIESATAGRTVLLGAGTYDPSGALTIPDMGTARYEDRLTVGNHGGAAVTVTGPVTFAGSATLLQGLTIDIGSEAAFGGILIESTTATVKRNIVLRWLDVSGATGETIRIRGNVQNVTLQNSILDGENVSGHTLKIRCDINTYPLEANCTQFPDNIRIINNSFAMTGTGVTGEDLLQVEGWNNIWVTNNSFGNNADGEDCVDIKGPGRSGSSMVFNYNQVNECPLEGILFHYEVPGTGHTEIIGNRLIGSQLIREVHPGGIFANNVLSGGILVYAGQDGVTMAYNTFLDATADMKFGDTTGGVVSALTMINNLFNGAAFTCTGGGCGTCTRDNEVLRNVTGSTCDSTCTSCPTGDPLLTEHVIGSGSSAENAASTNFQIGIDVEGTIRPQGAGYDIGSYERVP